MQRAGFCLNQSVMRRCHVSNKQLAQEGMQVTFAAKTSSIARVRQQEGATSMQPHLQISEVQL